MMKKDLLLKLLVLPALLALPFVTKAQDEEPVPVESLTQLQEAAGAEGGLFMFMGEATVASVMETEDGFLTILEDAEASLECMAMKPYAEGGIMTYAIFEAMPDETVDGGILYLIAEAEVSDGGDNPGEGGGDDGVVKGSIAEVREQFAGLSADEQVKAKFQLTSEMTVTHVMEDYYTYVYYMQDAEAGIKVMDYASSEPAYQVGDVVKDLSGSLSKLDGVHVLSASEFPAAISSGEAVSSVSIAVPELVAGLSMYESMLVTVADAMIDPEMKVESGLFAAGEWVEFTDMMGMETGEIALMGVFAGSDVDGAPFPEDIVPLTGLVSYHAAQDMVVVTPRSLDDLQPSAVELGIRTRGNDGGYAGWGIVGGPLMASYMIQLEGGVEEDITISCEYDGVTFTPQVVTPAEAAAGIGIQFSVMVSKEGSDSTYVTFTSGDIQHVDSIKWTGVRADVTGTIAECRADTLSGDFYRDIYQFSEPVQVVYAMPGSMGGYDYYVQDETGGIILNDFHATEPGYRTGDVVDNFYGSFMSGGGLDKKMLWMRIYYAPPAAGQVRELHFAPVTVEELLANPFTYESRVVKLENVTLALPEGKTKFEKNMNVSMTQGDAQITLKVLPESELVGQDIPTGALTVKGLSISGSGRFVAPLVMADLEPASGVAEVGDDVAVKVWCDGPMVKVSAEGLQALEAYALTGVKVVSVSGVDTVELPAGAYLLRVSTDRGVAVRKVVVR